MERNMIRKLKPTDHEALRVFFRSLSDETISLMNHFDSRGFKTNTEQGSILAASRLTSEIVVKGYPPDQYVLVAEEQEGYTDVPEVIEGRIVGLAWLDFPWKPRERFTCFLGIIVADAYQGKGLGSQLMKGLIDEAERRNMRKVCLRVYESNDRAVRLYDKFGFKTEGYFAQQEWEDEKPLDVYSMSLFL